MTGSFPASHAARSQAVVTWLVVGGLAWLAVGVRTGGPVEAAEQRWCRAPGPAPTWARRTSRLAEREAVATLVVTVAAHRWHTGRTPWPPVTAVVGGLVVRAGLAQVVRRPRPPQEWWRAEPHGWSFPSRHSLQALLAAAVLLDEICPDRPAVRFAGMVAATTGVGASRVRLGVHWPSDVLGAALTGALWLRLVRSTGRTTTT
jgi:membrane-associated phospholipid phosphatase